MPPLLVDGAPTENPRALESSQFPGGNTTKISEEKRLHCMHDSRIESLQCKVHNCQTYNAPSLPSQVC
jgi:hypothetical protein